MSKGCILTTVPAGPEVSPRDFVIGLRCALGCLAEQGAGITHVECHHNELRIHGRRGESSPGDLLALLGACAPCDVEVCEC